MKNRKDKIYNMVEDELLGMSKVMDVSESMKKLDKLKIRPREYISRTFLTIPFWKVIVKCFKRLYQ